MGELWIICECESCSERLNQIKVSSLANAKGNHFHAFCSCRCDKGEKASPFLTTTFIVDEDNVKDLKGSKEKWW